MDRTMDKLSDFKVGDRVQIHPALGAWMAGFRYGTVIRIGVVYLQCRMERLDKTLDIRVTPENVLEIVSV